MHQWYIFIQRNLLSAGRFLSLSLAKDSRPFRKFLNAIVVFW